MSTKETKERKFGFKIGADPEFSIVLQNKRIDAMQTMTEILKGKKEFKMDGHLGYNLEKWGNIGWDGARETGEVRPAPAYSPEEVVLNLRELFNAIGKYMSIFEFSTLSQHASIGGHIHLEASQGWNQQKQKALHLQMVSFYLPILMSENKVNLTLRIGQNYGSMTDFHYDSKRDGDVKTYEFRCPSAEWLTCPKIAQATLAYMAVIYHEILNHPKNMKKCKDILLKSDKQTQAFQTLALQEYGILNQALLKSISKAIRGFEMYEPFKDEIEFILHPDQVTKEKMRNNYDINIGWGLSDSNKFTKRQLISEKKFKEKIKEKDADIISKMVHIDYNSDAKVSDFVNALALRAGAFNWKLNRQYFIFGLKKGIKNIIVRNIAGEYLTGTDQIKTLSDYELISNAFGKMADKYGQTNSAPNLMTIDFKTGKTMSIRDNVVLIGLPYEMRMDGKTRPLIDMVWDIEAGNLKTCQIEQGKLSKEKGEIEKAKEQTEPTEIIEAEAIRAARIDNGRSQSSQNQQRALENIRNEEHNEEMSNSEAEYERAIGTELPRIRMTSPDPLTQERRNYVRSSDNDQT